MKMTAPNTLSLPHPAITQEPLACSLMLAEPNTTHLAYREGDNGLMLHVLTRIVAVGRSDGADGYFGAAPPRTLFHLPGPIASPASPCLAPALLKSRFFSLCSQHHDKQTTGGR